MAGVSVIGAGSWGMAIAKVLDTNGHEVTLSLIHISEPTRPY